MRILYHHRTLADGAEGIHIAEMVSAFRGLGHDVEVLGLAGAGAGTGGGGLLGPIRRVLPRAAYELASAACNVLEFRDVGQAVRRCRPDLLYKRHARNDVAALAIARRRGIASALEVNCLYSSPDYTQFEPQTFGRMSSRLELRALHLADLVLAVSTPLAEQIAALGVGHVRVLPNGANPETFRPAGTSRAARVRMGLPDRVTVGWAGILRDWHGPELLLDAIRRVPEVTLLVIGDGPEHPEFERRVRQLGLTDRVVMVGRVPYASMPDWLAAVDISVVADERTGVASPMKLLEYMAMGLGIVAPDLPNIRDLLTHDQDGWLFHPGDAADLSAGICALARDPDLRRRLGSSARATVERERNWRRNAEEVLQMLADPGLGNWRGTMAVPSRRAATTGRLD